MSDKDRDKSKSRAPAPSKSSTPTSPPVAYTTITVHQTDLWNLLKAELVQRTVSWFALRIFSAAPLAFYFAWRQQRRRRRLLRAKNKIPQGIAGSDSALQTLRTHVVTALRNSRALKKLNVAPVRGITVSGPSGCGKMEVIRMLCKESGAYFICLHVRELQTVEDTEAAFADAVQNAAYGRGVVLALARIDQLSEFGAHVVASMLDELACTDRSSRIKVLGTCAKVRDIDPQLRRVGRFELDVQLNDPTPEDRQEIFKLHTDSMNLETDVDFQWLADKTPGYSGSDIALLCSLAQQNAYKEKIQEISKDEEIIDSRDINNASVKVGLEDFKKALKDVDRPTTLRDFKIEVPEVQWEDIGGLDNVKREVRDLVQIPVQHPEVFKKLNVNPPKGLLLFGPPGCGKTMVARAIAKQCSANFIAIKGPELVSMWYGESAKGVERVFDRARQSSPCVLFFDEFDSIAQPRGSAFYSSGASTENDRIVAQLLNEMDGLSQDKLVFVVAATNSPNGVDTALLRPGRFDEIVYVPLPSAESRKQIFQTQLKNASLDEKIEVEDLVRRTEGYSGADVTYVCKRALKLAFRDAVNGFIDKQKPDQKQQQHQQQKQLLNNSVQQIITNNISENDQVITTQNQNLRHLKQNFEGQNSQNNDYVDLQFDYGNDDSDVQNESDSNQRVKIYLKYGDQQQVANEINQITRGINLDKIKQQRSKLDENQKRHLINGLIATSAYCILPFPGKKLMPLLRLGLVAPMFLIMSLDTIFPRHTQQHNQTQKQQQKQKQNRLFENADSLSVQTSQTTNMRDMRELQYENCKVACSESSIEQQSLVAQIENIDSNSNSGNKINTNNNNSIKLKFSDNLKIKKLHMDAALSDSRRSVTQQQAKHYDKLADSLKRQGAFMEGSDPPDGIYV